MPRVTQRPNTSVRLPRAQTRTLKGKLPKGAHAHSAQRAIGLAQPRMNPYQFLDVSGMSGPTSTT